MIKEAQVGMMWPPAEESYQSEAGEAQFKGQGSALLTAAFQPSETHVRPPPSRTVRK